MMSASYSGSPQQQTLNGMNKNSARRAVRSLSVLEKLAAIDRVHNGESKAAVARDLSVPESTLRGWCKSEEKLRGCSTRQNSASPSSLSEDAPLDFSSKDRVPPPIPKLISLHPLPLAAQSPPAYPDWRHQQVMPSQPDSPKEAGTAEGGSWFWKWYKSQESSNQINVKKRKFGAMTESEKEKQENTPSTAAEALNHGEKLLNWLETCSGPSVTAMQILQFRGLLDNIKDTMLPRDTSAASKIRRRK